MIELTEGPRASESQLEVQRKRGGWIRRALWSSDRRMWVNTSGRRIHFSRRHESKAPTPLQRNGKEDMTIHGLISPVQGETPSTKVLRVTSRGRSNDYLVSREAYPLRCLIILGTPLESKDAGETARGLCGCR